MSSGRKQVAFDLDTKALEEYYPSKSWNEAYEVIKRHMLKYGFLWQQGSVYVSEKSMTNIGVYYVIDQLIEKNQWLNICMRDCRQSNISRESNLSNRFDENAKVPKRDDNKKPQRKRGTQVVRKKSVEEISIIDNPKIKEIRDDR
ncbi:MAG: hypothetical protein FWD82_01270 [Defluviitaleaceae bacterium]|nr:hypothetical protein [Defluviitaleaceae bacterium]